MFPAATSLFERAGNARTSRSLRATLALAACALIGACQSLPANLPRFIEDNNTVLENQSESVVQAMQTMTDEAAQARQDVAAARARIARVAPAVADPAAAKELTQAERELGEAEKALAWIESKKSLPATSRERFNVVAQNYALVGSIVAEKIDSQKLLDDAAKLLPKNGGPK
jgi:septal ring factor EnvC (AmiA/AmiB activator)